MGKSLVERTYNIKIKTGRRYQADQQKITNLSNNETILKNKQSAYIDVLQELGKYLEQKMLSDSLIDQYSSDPNLLMVQLLSSGVDYDIALSLVQEFNEKYNDFFEAFACSIEDAESLGEYIGDTELNYGIGLLKESAVEMHVLNKTQMHDFIRNSSVFGIHASGQDNFAFSMKNNIGTDIIEQGIIAATGGDPNGGKNLARMLFGEQTLNLQQQTFEALSNMHIYTRKALYYQGMDERYKQNPISRFDSYKNSLQEKVQKGQITDKEMQKLISKREAAMSREISESRKFEGSYRYIIDGVVRLGMSEDQIIDAIQKDLNANKGWHYSDSVPGVIQGDLDNNQVRALWALSYGSNITDLNSESNWYSPNNNIIKIDPVVDISLKFGQDQTYNPDLYNTSTLFKTYTLMIAEAQAQNEEREVNSTDFVESSSDFAIIATDTATEVVEEEFME